MNLLYTTLIAFEPIVSTSGTKIANHNAIVTSRKGLRDGRIPAEAEFDANANAKTAREGVRLPSNSSNRPTRRLVRSPPPALRILSVRALRGPSDESGAMKIRR